MSPAVIASGLVAAAAVFVGAAALRPLVGSLARRRARGGRAAEAATAVAPVRSEERTSAERSSGAAGTGDVGSMPRRVAGIPGPGAGRLVPWARVRVRRAEAALRVALTAADVAVDVRPFVRRWAAVGTAAVALAGRRWGLPGAVLVTAVAAGSPLAALGWRRGRAAQRLSAALPGVLEAVAGRLRAGASLSEAMAGAADEPSGSALLDTDLGDLRRRVARGQPFVEAVEEWAERRPAPGVALVAAALVLGAEAGGARARAIDGVAATLRDRRAVAAEVDALATQARASAFVMMGAPVAFAALGLLSDPDVAHFLLATPAGLACLVVGLGLDALAGWWMVAIARSAR